MLFRIGLISMVGSTRRRNFQSRRVYPSEGDEGSPLGRDWLGIAIVMRTPVGVVLGLGGIPTIGAPRF